MSEDTNSSEISPKSNQPGGSNITQNEMLHNMQKLFLEALRHREQDIIRFLAILGPALAGYVWLLKEYYNEQIGLQTLIIGKIGIILILLCGAWYAITLGYNFRSILMQIAKIESALGITQFTLKKWPRKPKDFYDEPCYPPEIIKVFWFAFLIGIGVVGIDLDWFYKNNLGCCCCIPDIHRNLIAGFTPTIVSIIALIIGIKAPNRYKEKLIKLANEEDKEGEKWNFNKE
jgi:hypothetical protein